MGEHQEALGYPMQDGAQRAPLHYGAEISAEAAAALGKWDRKSSSPSPHCF